MLYFVYNTATNHSGCIIIYNAMAEVLHNVAQVPVANAATTAHLIGSKTFDCVLEFLYSLTWVDQLWQQTSFQG